MSPMKKTVKVALIIAGSIILLFLVLIVGGQALVKGEINKTFDKGTIEIGGTVYDIKAGKVKVSIPARSVVVSDISIRSQAGEDASRAEVTVNIGKASLKGIFYKKSRRTGDRHSIGARVLEIDTPNVFFQGPRHPVANKEKEEKGSGSALTGRFSLLSVKQIIVNTGSARITGWKDGHEYVYTVDGLSLEAEGFAMGEKADTAGKILFSDRIKAGADRFVTITKWGAMAMEIDGLAADSRDNSLSLDGFKMLPQYPRLEYAAKVWDHSDWTQTELENIKVFNIDYRGLVSDKAIKADSASIGGGKVASYKNRNIQPLNKVPLYYESLRKLSIPLDIPKIAISGIDVDYHELAPGADAPGAVTVTGITGELQGLTNRAAHEKQTFRLVADAKLMGKAPFHAVMTMPVDRRYDHWEFIGKIGEMDMQILNPAVENLANVRITSGMMHELDFHIVGNAATSHTTAVMSYDGLEIVLLKKHDHGRERHVLSFLADTLVIRHQNPDRRGHLHTGEGDAERDYYKSQFNFIVRSLIAGVKGILI